MAACSRDTSCAHVSCVSCVFCPSCASSPYIKHQKKTSECFRMAIQGQGLLVLLQLLFLGYTKKPTASIVQGTHGTQHQTYSPALSDLSCFTLSDFSDLTSLAELKNGASAPSKIVMAGNSDWKLLKSVFQQLEMICVPNGMERRKTVPLQRRLLQCVIQICNVQICLGFAIRNSHPLSPWRKHMRHITDLPVAPPSINLLLLFCFRFCLPSTCVGFGITGNLGALDPAQFPQQIRKAWTF